MILKSFTLKVTIRVLLLVATITLLSQIFGNPDLFFNQIILCIALVLQVIELIYFVNHTNRELAKLFYAVRHADFSISFKDNQLGKSFRELHGGFTTILETYKKVKIEKEGQFQFLQALVNQINIGILAVEGDSVIIINARAENLLNTRRTTDWALLRQLNRSLTETIDSLGEQGRRLVELQLADETKMVALEVNTLLLLERPIRLITLQDINSEIEQKEIEAWHKLIRILTHEIMNSVTPITSLTETMSGMLTSRQGNQKSLQELNEDTISDIRFSLDTIHNRSESLLKFVETYRKLSRIPKPTRTDVWLQEYFKYICNLLSSELTQENIQLAVSVQPASLLLQFDKTLIEQVLINLLTNSIHALKGRNEKRISIAAYRTDNAIIIEVADTGTGIPPKELKEIFVPFFSTKKNGSGIGLSLAKQIMTLHNGSITVSSTPNRGTSFFLRFRSSDEVVHQV